MRPPAALVLLGIALAAAGCQAQTTDSAATAARVDHDLSQVGIVCIVNAPGVVGSGESLSVTVHNTGSFVRVFLRSVAVGGADTAGREVGPDVVAVNQQIDLPPGQSASYGPFPLSDAAMENVGAVGGVCLPGGYVTS